MDATVTDDAKSTAEHAAATHMIGSCMTLLINAGISNDTVAQALAEAGAIGLITTHYPRAGLDDKQKLIEFISGRLGPVVDHTLSVLNNGVLGPNFGSKAQLN